MGVECERKKSIDSNSGSLECHVVITQSSGPRSVLRRSSSSESSRSSPRSSATTHSSMMSCRRSHPEPQVDAYAQPDARIVNARRESSSTGAFAASQRTNAAKCRVDNCNRAGTSLALGTARRSSSRLDRRSWPRRSMACRPDNVVLNLRRRRLDTFRPPATVTATSSGSRAC